MFREWRYRISIDRKNHAVVCPDAATFLEHGGELVKEFGVFGEFRIDSLSVMDCRARFSDLVRHPLVGRVRSLCFGTLDDGGATLLAAATLPRLRGLDASRSRVSAAGLRALMRASFTAQLEWLDLTDAPLGVDGGHALAGGRLSCLRRLLLSGCGLDSGGLEALVSAPWLPHVKVLQLARSKLDDGDAAMLARVRGPGPVELDLGDNLIEAAGVRALAAAPWRRLARLRLTGNRLFGEGVEDYYDQGIPVWSGPRTLAPQEIGERFGFAARGVEIL